MTAPLVGSQTHFLTQCTGTCGDGLECLCGVCTQGCARANDCSSLSEFASCESVPANCSAAVLVCAVECTGNEECSSLGGASVCRQGRCRVGPVSSTDDTGATLNRTLSRSELLGASCVQQSEDTTSFGGATIAEVNIETGHGECGDPEAVCLSTFFQGLASCPYGQSDLENPSCFTPLGEAVTVEVQPQLVARSAPESTYCSCACGGANGCDCPNGMVCEEIVPGANGDTFPTSWCVKPEGSLEVAGRSSEVCDRNLANCDLR